MQIGKTLFLIPESHLFSFPPSWRRQFCILTFVRIEIGVAWLNLWTSFGSRRHGNGQEWVGIHDFCAQIPDWNKKRKPIL